MNSVFDFVFLQVEKDVDLFLIQLTKQIVIFISVSSKVGNLDLCTVVDLRGGVRDVRPPSGPKFLHFHAVFRIGQIIGWLPPLGLVPPPLGNPGSATGVVT